VRVQVLHPRAHDDEAKDGQHLVCVQHPLLPLQSVHLVEPLDLPVHQLRTAVDRLHLADRRFGRFQLVEHQLALRVGLFAEHEPLEGELLFRGLEAGLDGPAVQAELLLDVEGGGRFLLQHLHDLLELGLAFLVEDERALVDDFVEELVLEEDGGGDAEEVVLVGDEGVVGEFSLREGVEVVVVDDCLLEDLDELVDGVDEFAHLRRSVGVVGEVAHDVVHELLLDLSQHTLRLAQLPLQDHRELQEHLQVPRRLPRHLPLAAEHRRQRVVHERHYRLPQSALGGTDARTALQLLAGAAPRGAVLEAGDFDLGLPAAEADGGGRAVGAVLEVLGGLAAGHQH
jgi:hypothetical protein